MNLLTLQYKKVSQSIIIVVHQCHFDFLVEVTLDDRGVDKIEKEKIAYFFETGCGCGSYRNGPCSRAFSIDHYESVRSQCQALDHSMLDFVFSRQIMASTSTSTTIQHRGHQIKDREKPRTQFMHEGVKVEYV